MAPVCAARLRGCENAAVKTMSAAQAAGYDSLMQRLERRFFPDTRAWVCRRAEGDTLEVAVGTGLNLPYYSEGVRLTAVDASPDMLVLARTRARALSRTVVFAVGDASALPYPDASFDSVVCTFALCEVPDDAQVVGELLRVLRPGGNLLLADHVIATGRFVRLAQRLLEAVTIPLGGEHYTRRPSRHLSAPTVELVHSDRFAHGAVEQVHARKAAGDPPAT